MFLTRAFLDPASRLVQADERNPEGLHKTIMRAFPKERGPSPRRMHAVLHRLEREADGRLVLLVQSRTRPSTDQWPAGYLIEMGGDLDFAVSSVGENPAIRSVGAALAGLLVGKSLNFRLRANTTKKIDTKTGPDGVRRNGRRVPVRGDEGRLAWLTRRASAAGFSFEDGAVRVTEVSPASGRGAKAVTVVGALFEGVLTIVEPALFRAALESGIGPAKAYGFGLLSIASVR